MKKLASLIFISLSGSLCTYAAYATPCAFDATKTCTLSVDILNSKSPAGLPYYAATNYNHTATGELDVYTSANVQPYQDRNNAPGQIQLILKQTGTKTYNSGEIMTRANLTQPPYNSPTPSSAWTTATLTHGYLAVTVKMPSCTTSNDGLCQRNTNSEEYNAGLWPAIVMLPTDDAVWPQYGEINIAEGYKSGSCFNNSQSTLHFIGTSPDCMNNDCENSGYLLGNGISNYALYTNYHTYGLEWQPDPANAGAELLTGYLDNVVIWGPISTASLPPTGPATFDSGFTNPAGGYYLVVNLAIGGAFAGAPSSHLQSSNMYIQSIKSYAVSAPPPINNCQPPINIQSMVSADMTQATLAWEAPLTGDPVANYQVNNSQNQVLWTGTTPTQRAFQDQTLPGTSGTFTYYLYTHCTTGLSSGVAYKVTDLRKRKTS